jgi:hypothetical protein
MRLFGYLSMMLFTAVSAWSQAVPQATGVPLNTDDEYRMATPPLVSADPFPTRARWEERSNYLRAGLTVTPAYADNVLVGFGTGSVPDMAYTVSPTLSFDKRVPRLQYTWQIDPGFTLFQRVTSRNAAYQNTAFRGEYRLTPHTAITWREAFRHTSNVFGQPYVFFPDSISGAPSSSSSDVAPIFAERLTNEANAELTFQPTMNALIGAGGSTMWYHFPDPSETQGLCDSNSLSASGFYSRRFSGTQYLGFTYQYSHVRQFPYGSELTIYTHGTLPFYMISLGKALTASVSGGMQYYHEAPNSFLSNGSWAPMLVGSLERQSGRLSIAAQGSRSVTGGGGLLGAYRTTTGTALLRWLPARSWALQASGAYSMRQNVSFLSLGNPGGHSVSGTISLDRALSERITLGFSYQREHLSYSHIESIARNPNLNRESISVSYHFSRALGR